MNESAYQEYLESPHWLMLRERALFRDGNQCVRCRETERLEVHHLTYARRGHELLDDLVTLCDACHVYTHDRQRVEAVMRSGGGFVRVRDILPAVFESLQKGWEKTA